ncbi:hypothetical protein BKA66DRAFT_463186 [Pyrenochaeta sp. MPI-SDFR-AT-0127]|nr:hypothetical protein BKA66DRAFT_463186 [Pyrenochaeta sp. MPI-SDFR-AT-0127]
MATYVVTGVSRGIGYGFLTHLTKDPKNTVIGIVRNKPVTDKKISEDPELKGRTNFHILSADMTDYAALKQAAADTAKITGGKIDYLIANAGLITLFDAYDPIGTFADRPKEIEETMRELFDVNVIGNVHLFNLFLPFILKGETKKVIVIASAWADPDWTNKYDLTPGSLYGASKAAMNLITCKYSAQYKKEGVLFLSLSPGMVEVGLYDGATKEQAEQLSKTLASLGSDYSPNFSGPITPLQSVEAMQKVWEKASIEGGYNGAFVSHNDNKIWV